MPNKLSAADRALISKLIDSNAQQTAMLKDIQICLKGSTALSIEGALPAIKRLDETLADIKQLEIEMRLYLGIITSKKLWRFAFFTLLFLVSLFIGLKYGWSTVWRMVKGMFT